MAFQNEDGITFQEFADWLHSFEEQHLEQIATWLLHGSAVWPIIKIKIYYKFLTREVVKASSASTEKDLSISKLKRLRQLLTAQSRLQRAKRGATLFYGSRPDYSLQNGILENHVWGKLIAPSLVQDFVVSTKHDPYKGKFAHGNPIFFSILQTAAKKAGRIKPDIATIHLLIEEIIPTLQAFFENIGYPSGIDKEMLLHTLEEFDCELLFFKEVFRKLNPKRIITSEQYGTGFAAAARQMNIPLIDFQHGIITKSESIYRHSPKLRALGSALPLPNYIAVYGEQVKEQFLNTSFWNASEIFVIGSIRVNEHRRRNVQVKKEKQVFFPHQSLFYKPSITLLENLAAVHKGEYSIVIKPHPLDQDVIVENLQKIAKQHPFIKLIPANGNTYETIAKSKALIGFNTTVLLEALALGVPAITIATAGMEQGLHTFIEGEQAKISLPVFDISNAEALHKKLVALCQESIDTAALEAAGAYFFANDYEKRVKQMLSTVAERT